MAEHTEVRVVDDLDKNLPGECRVILGMNDWVVSLDLSQPNYDHLKGLVLPYLEAGRRIDGLNLIIEELHRRVDPVKIRTWAENNGFQIRRTGRIPGEILTQYVKAEVAPHLT